MIEKKIKFIGFWEGFNEKNNVYYNILSKRYNVIISDEPDYIIATMYTSPEEYLHYVNCVRIMHSGEDFFPDMNIFDYAVGYDDFHLEGVVENNLVQRYFRWPFGCEWNLIDINKQLQEKDYQQASEILQKKKSFCNFIYAHESYKGKREKLLLALSEYKKIDCAGTFMNNMDNGKHVTMKEKIEFTKDYKFAIAAETVQYPGMTTEKIYDAFRANAIPIYFGDPYVKKTFNEEAFIYWDGKEENLNEVVKKVIEIDQNDEKFCKMIMAQKILKKDVISAKHREFAEWLYGIFDKDKYEVMQHLPINGPSQRSAYEQKLRWAFESTKKKRGVIRRIIDHYGI